MHLVCIKRLLCKLEMCYDISHSYLPNGHVSRFQAQVIKKVQNQLTWNIINKDLFPADRLTLTDLLLILRHNMRIQSPFFPPHGKKQKSSISKQSIRDTKPLNLFDMPIWSHFVWGIAAPLRSILSANLHVNSYASFKPILHNKLVKPSFTQIYPSYILQCIYPCYNVVLRKTIGCLNENVSNIHTLDSLIISESIHHIASRVLHEHNSAHETKLFPPVGVLWTAAKAASEGQGTLESNGGCCCWRREIMQSFLHKQKYKMTSGYHIYIHSPSSPLQTYFHPPFW